MGARSAHATLVNCWDQPGCGGASCTSAGTAGSAGVRGCRGTQTKANVLGYKRIVFAGVYLSSVLHTCPSEGATGARLVIRNLGCIFVHPRRCTSTFAMF